MATDPTLAIVAGLVAILVFVLTQSFLMLFLEPIREQKRLIGEVASALTVYEKSFTLRVEPSGPLFSATKEEATEAHKALRELAGRLRGSLWTIPLYDVFALIGLVRKLADVVAEANALQAWYSQLPQEVSGYQVEYIRECQQIIAKRLGIEERLKVISVPLIRSEAEVFSPRFTEKTR